MSNRAAWWLVSMQCLLVGCGGGPEYSVRLENETDFVVENMYTEFDDYFRSISRAASRGAHTGMGPVTRIPEVARVFWATADGRQHCVDIRVADIVPDGFPKDRASTLIIAMVDPDTVTIKFEVPDKYGGEPGYRGMLSVLAYKYLEPRGPVTTQQCP